MINSNTGGGGSSLDRKASVKPKSIRSHNSAGGIAGAVGRIQVIELDTNVFLFCYCFKFQVTVLLLHYVYYCLRFFDLIRMLASLCSTCTKFSSWAKSFVYIYIISELSLPQEFSLSKNSTNLKFFFLFIKMCKKKLGFYSSFYACPRGFGLLFSACNGTCPDGVYETR